MTKRIGSKISNYFPALTGFRAFAAFLVYMNHFYTHWYLSELKTWIQNFSKPSGRCGVTLFFALSGFLITKIYFDRFAEKSLGFGEYWLRRFAKIFPAYLLLVSFKMIVSYFDPSLEWHAHFSRPNFKWQLLTDLTLTHAFFPAFIWSGLSPGWSLTVEESFYLLAPLLFIWIARTNIANRPKYLYSFLGGVTFLLWWLGGSLHNQGWGDFLSNYELTYTHSIFGKFGVFAIGMACAFLFRSVSGNKQKNPIFAELLFLSGLSLMAVYLSVMPHHPPETEVARWAFVDVMAGGLGTALFISGSVMGSRLAHRIFGNPVIEYLGKISFIFYMLQESFYAFYICGKINTWTPWPRSFWLSYLAISIVAAVLYECFEKPVHRFVITLYEKRNSKKHSKVLIHRRAA